MASLRSRVFRKMLQNMPRPPWEASGAPTGIEWLMGRRAGGEPLTLERWRAELEALVSRVPTPRGVTFEPVHANGVPGEWVTAPSARSDRVMLYLHGGGYISNSPRTHRGLTGRLTKLTGARILALDYRLGPEHPFPAALHDALTGYRWLLGQGIAAGHIAVAGDSAGGGLAVASMLAMKEAGDPLARAGVCLSPWTDLVMTGESMSTRAGVDPVLSRRDLEHMAAYYLKGADPTEPTASPLYGDPAGLPPLLIQVGRDEILLDDARRFAERARAAGVRVQMDIWEGMFHVWHMGAGFVPEANQALAEIGTFLRSVYR